MLTGNHQDDDTICREVQEDLRCGEPAMCTKSLNQTSFNDEVVKYSLKVHVPDEKEAQLVKMFTQNMGVDHSVSEESPRDITGPFYCDSEDRENEGDVCNATDKSEPIFSLDGGGKSFPRKETSFQSAVEYSIREKPFKQNENNAHSSLKIQDARVTLLESKEKPKDVLAEVQLPLRVKSEIRDAEYFMRMRRPQKPETHAKPPRPNPSPIHQRLAMAKTKSVELRQESRGRFRDDFHSQHKQRVPFYCTVSSASVASGLTGDSFFASSSHSSEESPVQEKKTRRVRSKSQNRIQQAMSIASSSSPSTCDLPERKRTSTSTGRLRPAFYCTVNSASSVSSSTRSSRTNITPKRRARTRESGPLNQRPVFSGSLNKTSPRIKSQLYKDEGSDHSKSTKSRGKLSPFETESLYHRLSRHDTYSSSKRMTPSPGRKVTRSPYELSKMEKKPLSGGGMRNKKTTSDFFERMSKEQTFSTFSKSQIAGLPTDKLPEE